MEFVEIINYFILNPIQVIMDPAVHTNPACSMLPTESLNTMAQFRNVFNGKFSPSHRLEVDILTQIESVRTPRIL